MISFIIILAVLLSLVVFIIFKMKSDRDKLSDDKNYIEPEITEIEEVSDEK